ncbi:hypothetical protein N8T08_002175 [Aspergillus melleus]|uniref:Uncharacterized protein n=1 Tax=Aspergillus melleus TaxID=138277 RepID=A0ACC3B8W9_9EURO|nr:hypothetical protein N8T08_002175 [Aspergillus melleus]
MQLPSLVTFALLVTGSLAYNNNCKGSSRNLNTKDCDKALNSINKDLTYKDQSQFSVGNCYVIYATNGSGDKRVSGQKIHDTVKTIIDTCSDHKGSFGTGNCDACHVTVNYQVPKRRLQALGEEEE